MLVSILFALQLLHLPVALGQVENKEKSCYKSLGGECVPPATKYKEKCKRTVLIA
jgi:hypothetical protein